MKKKVYLRPDVFVIRGEAEAYCLPENSWTVGGENGSRMPVIEGMPDETGENADPFLNNGTSAKAIDRSKLWE